MFLGFLTVSVPLPVLPLHVHGTLGFGTAMAGLAVGMQSLATVLTRAYAGLAMSWNGMAQYGALAMGAPLGFTLYEAFGFPAVVWATVFLPLAALAVVLPLDPAPAPGGVRLPLLGVVRRIWRPGVALMLAGIGYASVSAFASCSLQRGAGLGQATRCSRSACASSPCAPWWAACRTGSGAGPSHPGPWLWARPGRRCYGSRRARRWRWPARG
jgi:MFS family permease